MGRRKGSAFKAGPFLFGLRRVTTVFWATVFYAGLALATGCTAPEPSVLDPAPDKSWLTDEARRLQRRALQESPLPSRFLVAASSAAGRLAWLEQGESEVDLWLAPAEDPGAGRKIATVALDQGFFNLTLSPDGQRCLLMRQDPAVNIPREQAVLDLYSLADGSHKEVSRSAAVGFEPTWTDTETFLFAEATSDFNRVLERGVDGTMSQAFALEARYPRLVIAPLAPQGWVVYDRTRPLDTHCWVRTTTSQGPAWAEVLLLDHQVRLLGWRQERPIVLVRDSGSSSRVVALDKDALDLPAGKLNLEGDQLATIGSADFALLKKDKVAFLQPGVWGHELRMLDLRRRTNTVVPLPCEPAQGSKFRSSGPSQAIFSYEGPFQPPSVASLDFESSRLSPMKVNALTGLDPASVTLEVDQERVWLSPRTAQGSAPILVEAYGAFRQTILPYFDWARLEWLRRGGRVVIEQIDVGPRGLEAVSQELLKRTEAPKGSLVLRGQSAGGTLVLLAMLASPERFSAVWADAPVTDLVNFVHLAPGDLWVAELGDARDPADLERLKRLSPLARLRAGVDYPRLVLSAAPDDVAVDTRHATRFVQRAREVDPGGEVFFLWETVGIHGRLRPLASELVIAIDILWDAATKSPSASTRVQDGRSEAR